MNLDLKKYGGCSISVILAGSSRPLFFHLNIEIGSECGKIHQGKAQVSTLPQVSNIPSSLSSSFLDQVDISLTASKTEEKVSPNYPMHQNVQNLIILYMKSFWRQIVGIFGPELNKIKMQTISYISMNLNLFAYFSTEGTFKNRKTFSTETINN